MTNMKEIDALMKEIESALPNPADQFAWAVDQIIKREKLNESENK